MHSEFNEVESVEQAEPLSRSECEGLAGRLEAAIEELAEAIERGESYDYHEQALVESLGRQIELGLGFLVSLVETLAKTAETLGGGSERAEQLVDGLERAAEVLRNGAEWLREHPEVRDAVLRIAVLGALAVQRPEAFEKVLESREGALTDRLLSLADALSYA